MSLTGTPLPSVQRTVVVVLADAAPAQGLAELRTCLSGVLSAGNARLVVDVGGLERLSSSVVAALLRAKRKGRARGVEVIVRGASDQSLGLLQRTGLAAVLDLERREG